MLKETIMKQLRICYQSMLMFNLKRREESHSCTKFLKTNAMKSTTYAVRRPVDPLFYKLVITLALKTTSLSLVSLLSLFLMHGTRKILYSSNKAIPVILKLPMRIIYMLLVLEQSILTTELLSRN